MKKERIENNAEGKFAEEAIIAHKDAEPDWEHGDMTGYEFIPGEDEDFVEITYEDFTVFRYFKKDDKIGYIQLW